MSTTRGGTNKINGLKERKKIKQRLIYIFYNKKNQTYKGIGMGGSNE